MAVSHDMKAKEGEKKEGERECSSMHVCIDMYCIVANITLGLGNKCGFPHSVFFFFVIALFMCNV